MNLLWLYEENFWKSFDWIFSLAATRIIGISTRTRTRTRARVRVYIHNVWGATEGAWGAGRPCQGRVANFVERSRSRRREKVVEKCKIRIFWQFLIFWMFLIFRIFWQFKKIKKIKSLTTFYNYYYIIRWYAGLLYKLQQLYKCS